MTKPRTIERKQLIAEYEHLLDKAKAFEPKLYDGNARDCSETNVSRQLAAVALRLHRLADSS